MISYDPAYITLKTVRLSYIDSGQKGAPVIIFIHGFPLNKSMWRAQMNALSTFRVITYDIRGHGDSEQGTDEFSIDLFAQDLIGMMDELELDQAVICGLSMGGYIALNALQKFPGRFSGLVLCDTQCVADSPEAKETRMKAIVSLEKEGIDKYAGDSIKGLFSATSISGKLPVVDDVKEMIVNTTEESIRQTLLALADRRETCSALAEINIPVLIIVGREDSITPPAAAEYLHENIPGSTLYIIDGAGHMSNMEKPVEFNKQLSRFLEQFQ